ncbi:hypothetical protein F4604DRAFT_1688677 [Suillus subluteus]|nr:hypothetical protein F4604DRAFT_1688677 [Suillus subluteus]
MPKSNQHVEVFKQTSSAYLFGDDQDDTQVFDDSSSQCLSSLDHLKRNIDAFICAHDEVIERLSKDVTKLQNSQDEYSKIQAVFHKTNDNQEKGINRLEDRLTDLCLDMTNMEDKTTESLARI